MIIVVMGVSGAGKSTLGRALARILDWDFIEGDAYHPPANVAKMRSGRPLDDADRGPWLDALREVMADHLARGRDGVLACSALRRSHRERMAKGLAEVRFVYLCGDPVVIRERVAARRGHFMPPALLDSQVAALEPPDDAVLVAVEWPTARQVDHTVQALGLGRLADAAP